jgi:uncharacterized protein YndB with AHSA1/START domain
VTTTFDGVLQQTPDGLYELRFERLFPYPVEKVWAALSEPDQIGKWLAGGNIAPVTGQEFTLRWDHTGDTMDSRVIRADAPRLLEFVWQFGDGPASVVRWELAPDPAGTRFTLTHTGLSTNELEDTAPGWHAHLDLLEKLLNGAPAPWNWEPFNVLKAHYLEVLAERGIAVASTDAASTRAD